MRIATLQFAPSVGEIERNIKRANELLKDAEDGGRLDEIDILVLPEMAFSGYNHPSLSAIKPYLEPTKSGVSTEWAIKTAQRLRCIVAVGYPEYTVPDSQREPVPDSTSEILEFQPSYYNALVFVSPVGEILAHYRKTFLYYTDETWAVENPDGFYSGSLPLSLSEQSKPSHIPEAESGQAVQPIKVAAGICMDINPHKFTAPWSAYEFANHCLESRAQLVILSMAWLTRLSGIDVEINKDSPDLNTVGYWVERFSPLLSSNTIANGNSKEHDQESNETKDTDTTSTAQAVNPETKTPSSSSPSPSSLGNRCSIETNNEIIVIFANRSGYEGTAPLIGDVRYAGSSCVMGMKPPRSSHDSITDGQVRIWDILGRGIEGVLVVDTQADAKYALRTKDKSTEDQDEDEEDVNDDR